MEARATRTNKGTSAHRTFKPVDQIIRFRYLIGLLLLLLVVAFNLNGSSIGRWSDQVSERSDGKKSDVIFGKNRAVRSDEWLVQTPFYLSQAEKGYPVINPDFGISGQNMIIAYNSPVKDITVIGKPFNWGFFFLGRDRGLSFYWGFKIIGMVLLGFELAMILTKRNKYLSLLGAFWLAFSPAVQWWFMQHVGDLIFFTMAIMVAVYYYFAKHSNRLVRVLMMGLAVMCGIGFALVLYPAHQVPLAYLILFWMVGVFLHFRKEIQWDVFDAFVILIGLGMVVFILYHFYSVSKDALEKTMNTVYPGQRKSTGGGLNFSNLFYFLMNWKLPSDDFTLDGWNNSEVAAYYHFSFLALLVSPFIFFNKKGKQEKYLGLLLGAFCLFIFAWIFIGFPELLAKIMLLTYVPSTRGMMSFGFASVLLSIWLINYLWEYVKIPKVIRFLIVVLSVFVCRNLILSSVMARYLTETDQYLTLAFVAVILLAILFKWRKIFFLVSSFVVVVSGMLVNPITQGTGAIYKTTLAEEMMKINRFNPDKLWLSENDLYNFAPALGIRSVNTVMFYPDFKLWDIVDPSGENERIYNRYAHTRAYVTDKGTTFNLISPDSFIVNLNFAAVKKLGVHYIVSQRSLEEYNPLHFAQFNKLYGPDKDKNRIYEVTFSENETSGSQGQIGVGLTNFE